MAILAAGYHSQAQPDYFSRPRAYSKPTKEELKQLDSLLSQRCAQELQQLCSFAAAESPEVAHLFVRVLQQGILSTTTPLQPVQHEQGLSRTSRDLTTTDNGLLTPTEDVNQMDVQGDNVQWPATIDAQSRQILPFTQPTPTISSLQSPSFRHPRKRKSLADKDDEVLCGSPRPMAINNKRSRLAESG